VNQDPEMMESEPSDGGREMNLLNFLAVCQKRVWLIGGLALAIGFVIALWSVLQVPIYQTTATLVFDSPGRRAIMKEAAYDIPEAKESELNTQEKLLQSYPVLAEAVKRLHLEQYPEYQSKPSWFQKLTEKIQPRWWEDVSSWLQQIKVSVKEFLVGPRRETSGPVENLDDDQFPDPAEQGLVNWFSSNVEVEWVPGTKLMNMTVQSEDPIFAAQAANTLANVYIDKVQELRSQATQSASQWFTNHLTQLRANVEKSEQALLSYRSKHGLLKAKQQQGVTQQKFSLLYTELESAERQLTELGTKVQMIEKIRGRLRDEEIKQSLSQSDLHELKDVLDSPEIQQIRRKEIELSITLTELSERYGSLHPEITRLQIQRRALQTRLREEIEDAYKILKAEYDLARERQKAVQKRLAKQNIENLADDKFSAPLGHLEGEANSNRLLYDSFLKQMRETNLSTEIKSTTVYLGIPAIPNRSPFKPTPFRNTAFGLLFGLALGIGLSFFLEYRDRSLKGPEDLDQYLAGFQVIGWVPRVPESQNKDLSRIIESEPLSALADSYRHIRTSVRLISSRESSTEVLITSPSAQEGKTTLAVNLAIGMAQIEGYRVVLIDGDMRRPRLDQIFGLQQQNGKSKGLSDYLAKRVEISEILHQSDIPNLTVIPVGTLSMDFTELLHSPRLATLLQWCRDRNFYVIIDGPPVLGLGDSLVLANQVSDTIFTVSAGETDREGAQLAMQQLIGHGARILGIVMQKVSQDRMEYYSNSYTAISVGPGKQDSNRRISWKGSLM